MTALSRAWTAAATLILAGTLAACGGGSDDDSAGGETTDGEATTSSASGGGGEATASEDSTSAGATDDSTGDGSDDAAGSVTVDTTETDLGEILVDGDGMTLYLFTNDTPGVSNCEGDCLAAWPPLLGTPEAGEGADDSKLGTLVRSDGSTQVSYNGWPLYYWMNDSAPGDVSGQGVNGVWWVLDRDGEPVGM